MPNARSRLVTRHRRPVRPKADIQRSRRLTLGQLDRMHPLAVTPPEITSATVAGVHARLADRDHEAAHPPPVGGARPRSCRQVGSS
jgi:hypothetical protein